MNAANLFEATRSALRIAGWPEWDSPDAPGQRDALAVLDGEAGEETAVWALAPVGSGSSVHLEDPGFVPLDSLIAESLIKAHLRDWLLERSWQLQVSVWNQRRCWRLVDCLATTDGGGDRLDEDYPASEDELAALCRSVIVVARSAVP